MRLLAIIPLIISVSAFAKPCGLEGKIDERIKDCNQLKGSFALVTVTEKGLEFYKDQKSGLIWGYRISSDFNQYGSQKACSEKVSGYPLVKLRWRLPTLREFQRAAAHGMKSALPNMDRFYWTSTPVRRRKYRRRRRGPPLAYMWDGTEDRNDTGDLKDAASVRCVARH